MINLTFQVLAWPTFGIALLVFGFAPGAVLRLIVLVFRRDDPRRKELLAELYAVPRIERPFWVAEQFEVALFEGLRGRLAVGRIKRRRSRWILADDGVIDWQAVAVAADGERRLRLTRLEQRLAAAIVLRRGGTVWTIAKHLHLRYGAALRVRGSTLFRGEQDERAARDMIQYGSIPAMARTGGSDHAGLSEDRVTE